MPAHKIVNDHRLDRFHRLVGKPPTSCGRNTAAGSRYAYSRHACMRGSQPVSMTWIDPVTR
jgi:hypothetical protein